MKQLELPISDLLAMGFTRKDCPDSVDLEGNFYRAITIYFIPCLNGIFYYNQSELEYRWYQKIVICEFSNDIHLDITTKPALISLLQIFRVKFNWGAL